MSERGPRRRDRSPALQGQGDQLRHSGVRDLDNQPPGGRRARLQPGLPVLHKRTEGVLFHDRGVHFGARFDQYGV